jgi:hypothetical protein
MKIWKQAGRPTDSVDIAEMMGNLGMSDEDIRALMTKSGLSAEDVEATMRGLSGKEGDETIEAPFKSGIESLDAEALEILKKKGEVAFDEFWKTKLPELEKKAEPPKDAEPAAPAKPADTGKEEPSGTQATLAAVRASRAKGKTPKKKPSSKQKKSSPKVEGALLRRPRASESLGEKINTQIQAVRKIKQALQEGRISREYALEQVKPLYKLYGIKE